MVEMKREIDVDQQLAEYQVAVFELLDEAMGNSDIKDAWTVVPDRQASGDSRPFGYPS